MMSLRSFALAEPGLPKASLARRSLLSWLLTLFRRTDFSDLSISGYPEAFNPFPGFRPLLGDASSFRQMVSFRYRLAFKAFALNGSVFD